MMRTIKTLVFSVFVIMTVCAGVVQAAGTDQWPTKPIELYIGWPPGGTVDAVVRAYLPTFSKELGVPVVINYKPGAGGALCAEFIAKSKPDGYTIQESSYMIVSVDLLLTNTPVTFNDFTYVLAHSGVPCALAARQDAPWKTFKEWVEYARKKPGSTYGVVGIYNTATLAMEWIIKREGLQTNKVPFQGGGELIAPVLGGHIDTAVMWGAHVPLVESGKLKTLLQLAGEPADPIKVQSISEVYPDFPETLRLAVELPIGMTGPKGMPAPIVQKLAKALKKSVTEEQYRMFLKQTKRSLVLWEGEDAFKKVKMATEGYAAMLKEVGFVKK